VKTSISSLIAAVLILVVGSSARDRGGAIPPNVGITTLPTTITQNFDTLPASGSATWTNDSTIPGWYHARTGTGTFLKEVST
jgi:hypothetical protein